MTAEPLVAGPQVTLGAQVRVKVIPIRPETIGLRPETIDMMAIPCLEPHCDTL